MKKTIAKNAKGSIVLPLTLVMIAAFVFCSAACSGSDSNSTVSTTYGTVDWSTAAQGYITFTAAGQERGFILQGPNTGNQFFITVTKDESAEIALADGSGRYQYAILDKKEEKTSCPILYKNSFNVRKNEST